MRASPASHSLARSVVEATRESTMHRRRVIIALSTLGLTACTGAPQAAQAPVVVTQLVRETVVVKQTVVVTATARPATATPKATVTPAVTAEPTAEPTATPQPGFEARTTQQASLYGLPDEENYKVRATLEAGTVVQVLHRGGQWFEVAVNGDQGWLYRDWIDLPADSPVPTYPESRPILIGKIVQEFLGGGVVFKGRVLNIGALPAFRVQVEVETFDTANKRVDLAQGLTDPSDMAAETFASFSVITLTDAWDTYIARVTWDV